MLCTRNLFQYIDMGGLKVTGGTKVYHTNINQKKVGMAVLVSDLKTTTKNLEGEKMTRTFCKDKKISNQENMAILKVHVQTKTCNYVKQKLRREKENP